MSDPKGALNPSKVVDRQRQSALSHSKNFKKRNLAAQTDTKMAESNKFLQERPYDVDTVFGYTTLVDTHQELKSAVYAKDKTSSNLLIKKGGLEEGEAKMMKMLNDGQFFAHTGIYFVTIILAKI